MNPLQFLRKITKKSSYEKGENYELGHSLISTNPYAYYKTNDYENAYPSITRIAQTFMLIEPYTIDKNGKPVSSNILDRLYTPNTDMSAADFREALAVMTAVHNKVHIRVHYKGNKLTADKITGFTFLENAVEMIRDKKRYYHLPNGTVLSSDEVITLKSINPYDITEGFSPTQSARKWITVDDYIATYQAGFFKNGAVPAGQFIITAKTTTEFNDIVDNLQSKHRGAGKNNNVVYAHRPMDATGKPTEAQIEWVPYNTTNKDLSMKDLFEQANKKIDSAYGVPASIRGVNDQNSYASVRVDEVIFTKYVVKPISLKIWSKFTHELNRVTGGTGVAIDFDLEIPAIADEEKVKAEAKNLDMNLIAKATEAGYSLDSVVDSFGLSVAYKQLKMDNKKPVIENDKPQVADSDELKDTPEPELPLYKKLKIKQISSRDYPDLYDGTGINPDDLGCIMLDVEKLEISKYVDGAENDLVTSTDRHNHTMGIIGEIEPHVTLLYGLLENGNVWKDKVDELLSDWQLSNVSIDKIEHFDTPDSIAIVAKVKLTKELQDGHDRLTLLPHINTFSEYIPHITLAYIKKDADIEKWEKALNSKYKSKTVRVTGINYGKLPASDESKTLKIKQMNADVRAEYETKVKTIALRQMEKQAINALENVESKVITPTEEDIVTFASDLQTTLVPLIYLEGAIQRDIGFNLVLEAGLDVSGITNFTMTPEQLAEYKEYLRLVGRSYTETNAEAIRQILARSAEQQLTAQQTRRAVLDFVKEEWRAERIAVTETNKAGTKGSLDAMVNIARQTGYKIEKVWTHNGSDAPCEYCQAMIGTVVDVTESFVPLGAEVIGADGGVFVNDFASIDAGDIHPNGHCGLTYRVRR